MVPLLSTIMAVKSLHENAVVADSLHVGTDLSLVRSSSFRAPSTMRRYFEI